MLKLDWKVLRYRCFFCLFFAFCVLSKISSQGLLFHANDELIAKRTSYSVFEHKSQYFKGFLKLTFDLSVQDPMPVGEVCYIENQVDETSYALTLSNEQNIVYLKLNIPGKQCLATIPLQTKDLGYRKWQKITIIFDGQQGEVCLSVNENTFCSKLALKDIYRPKIIFGKHDSYVDVPKIAIRNLNIQDADRIISFLFNESNGEDVYDSKGEKYGMVENPLWLINDSYNWKLRCEQSFGKPAVINFDSIRQQFVLLDRDSAFQFDLSANKMIPIRYANPCPEDIRLGNSFIDDRNNQMYVYEVNNLPHNRVSIATFDLLNYKWKEQSLIQLPQQRHHHSLFFDSERNSFTIFGGFGNQRFSNSFDTYLIDKNEWIIENFSGDVINPRFYSGQTQINAGQTLLFGGIGNQTGDQSIGRYYTYDCYLIDYSKKTIRKLWEIPLSKTGLVTVRNMIFNKDSNSFYTLCYPEYISAMHLKLYRFSAKNGSYEILGDSVPYISERIESNANLYYNDHTHEFYCTTQVFAPNGSSVIKIYSLASPPLARENIFPVQSRSKWWTIGIGAFVILLAGFIYFRRKRTETKNKQIQEKITGMELTPDPPKANSLYVFGDFTVMDCRNKDITYLFSPKVKQLFLYILFSGIETGEGVNSQKIHTAIWPDKTPENVKNLKGVTLNQIRKILTDIEGLELVYKNGNLKFELSDNLYFDYQEFIKLANLEKPEPLQEQTLRRMAEITVRGAFLKYVDFPEIQPVKHILVKKIKNILMPELISNFKKHKYMRVLFLAKTLYQMDNTDEKAFRYEIESYIKLGLTDIARKRAIANPTLNLPKYLLNLLKISYIDLD